MRLSNDESAGKTSRGSGFTLMELLVVIAIISILASILFPVFARARENARKTTCLSNTKQIGIAVQMYTQDHDERLPGHSYPSGGTITTYAHRIEPYLKSRNAMYCPNDKLNNPYKPLTTANLSYGYNYQFLSFGLSGTDGAGNLKTTYGKLLSQVGKPAETVLVTDTGSRPGGGAYLAVWDQNPAYRTVGDYRVMALHLEGANVAFLDGHSKWYKCPGPLVQDNTMWDLN
jgi:prepilin-type N-terminal cleavage/methylation domain-containing protein/prepilin-type processing-associated H-X9-DG protein